MSRERMNVYITTSKRHLAYAYVSIYSLFQNNCDSEIYLYIVSEDITDEDLINEYLIANKYGHHIVVIPFDEEMARRYTESSDEKHWPMTTMSCYWLFHVLLPEDVDRIIAIESDTVILGSLSELYHTNLHDQYMACPGPEHKPLSHHEFIDRLGGQCVTFVLSVYDVKKIRQDFSLEQILETDKKVRKFAGHSQMEFTFGILFNGHIKYLPGRESCLDENREYMKILGWDYISECEKTCKLLHFSSYEDYAKPWNPVELMPGYYYWWKYAKESPYYKEYMERQWMIYGNSIKKKQRLEKMISNRNIICTAYMISIIFIIMFCTLKMQNITYGLIIVSFCAISILMAWGIRKFLIYINNKRMQKRA